MTARRVLDATLMRGGTSRGIVLDLDVAPVAGAGRDDLARGLIGRTPVAGLGGGTPITNKVVLVGAGQSPEAELDYQVGNVSADGQTVDWSGTCGNMTSAVVPYAYLRGAVGCPAGDQPYRLRNLSTGGLVEVTVSGGEPALADEGADLRLTTSFLDPGGAVLGRTLPTGNPRDVVQVDGVAFDFSLVDVTHPYLFLSDRQVVGDGRLEDPRIQARIELIRGQVCVRLGLCAVPDEARVALAAVPRVVLVHAPPGDGADVRITAISMGQPITSVPVTAALTLAAARGIAGTIVGGRRAGTGAVLVAGPAGTLGARAVVDQAGRVRSASVERTARVLMRGRVWV